MKMFVCLMVIFSLFLSPVLAQKLTPYQERQLELMEQQVQATQEQAEAIDRQRRDIDRQRQIQFLLNQREKQKEQQRDPEQERRDNRLRDSILGPGWRW